MNPTPEQLERFVSETHGKIDEINNVLKDEKVDQAWVDKQLKFVMKTIVHARSINAVEPEKELHELWKKLKLWPKEYTEQAWHEYIKKQQTLKELGGKPARRGGRKAKKSHKKGHKGGKKSHKKGHKGARSKTRRGRLDFITHKGSKVFNRRSHYQKKTAKGVKKSPY